MYHGVSRRGAFQAGGKASTKLLRQQGPEGTGNSKDPNMRAERESGAVGHTGLVGQWRAVSE